MSEILDGFNERWKRLSGGIEASKGLHSDDINRRQVAIALAEEGYNEHGIPGSHLNTADLAEINNYMGMHLDDIQKSGIKYFTDNLEALLTDRDARDGLVNKVLDIPGVKIEKADHDAVVDLHMKYLGLEALARGYKAKQIDHGDLVNELASYVMDLIERKYDANVPENEHRDESFVKNAKAIVMRTMQTNERAVISALSWVTEDMKERIGKLLPTEESLLTYSQNNIRATYASGDEGQIRAAGLYNHAINSNNGNGLAGRIRPQEELARAA